MNGIEKITHRIETDAQAEIDAVLKKAGEEADKITASYQKKAADEAEVLRARNEKRADERKERLISAAQMEARKTQLAAKQEMLEAAYDLALEKLCSMPEADYVNVLVSLLQKASVTGKEEIILSSADREKIGKALVEKANAGGKHLKLSEETADIRGGFILRADKVEVNCAFETLVRLQRAETAGAVAKILFA